MTPHQKRSSKLAAIEDAIAAIARGEIVVVVDDEDRENEGDLVFAAEKITPQRMNFILEHGRGTVCLALTHEQCEKLRLHAQTDHNTATLATASRFISTPSTSITAIFSPERRTMFFLRSTKNSERSSPS